VGAQRIDVGADGPDVQLMNFLDVLLGIPLLWFTYKGFTKGFVIELATLVALLLGIYAAIHFSEQVGVFIADKISIRKGYITMLSFTIEITLSPNKNSRLLLRIISK